jgi:hypothetical protein
MPAVTFDGEELYLDALLVGAVADGSWAELRTALRRGVVADQARPKLDTSAVRTAESSFRRTRGLLAGEDLLAWLAEREVTVGDWRAHVRRMLLAEEPPLPDSHPVSNTVLAAAEHTALAVEDVAARAARRLLLGAAAGGPAPAHDPRHALALATRAADDPALPLADRNLRSLSAHAARVLRLRGQMERARTEVDARAVRETVAEHRLDWTVLVYDELIVPTEPAAREAVLCVSEDRMDLAAVGLIAGAPVHQGRRIAAQGANPHLLAGETGAPLGPIFGADGWRVLVVRERRTPALDDPDTYARARELALERILDRRLAGRVRWHVVH